MNLAKCIAIAVLAGALTTSCSYSPTGAARMEARHAFTQRLKSPGTASFNKTDIVARADEDRLYVIYLEVDSQNAYGGIVRSYGLALVMAGQTIEDDCQLLHLEVSNDSPRVARVKELTLEMGDDWVLEDWLEG